MLKANWTTGGDCNTATEDLAAELAEAAYPMLLRNAPGENWLDLELELWRTLKNAVGKWTRVWPQAEAIAVPADQQEADCHELPVIRHA
jgi:hypothetical protein